jgi:HEAT repeat protein
MRWTALVLVLVGTAAAQPPAATPTPPIDPKIDFKVSLVGERHEFHIGEIISIKLAFSSRIKDRYQLNEAQYDRSGRMDYEHFIVTPADCAIDPLADYYNEPHMGGGLTGFTFLKKTLWTIQLNLNEWVRFTKPGEYRQRLQSKRVEFVNRSSPHGTSPITAISNEIPLKILPTDPAWQKEAYEKAVAQLKAYPSAEDENQREKALETLRYLGTPDATRELVRQMRDESAGRLDFICYIGLVSSPERAVAREALEQSVADPDHPIDETFLDTLISLERSNVNRNITSTEDEQRVLEKVAKTLPNKRGKALRVSLYSLLNYVWIPLDKQLLPKETIQKLVMQLLSIFDQLSAKQQGWLLQVRSEQIKSPALLPLLKRYAQQDFSKVAKEEYYDARQLTIWALRRWFELDPAGARLAIIKEISDPHPRFDAYELGILPEKTLPEIDKALSDHFTAADVDASWNLAPLIARYATGAILPNVLQKIDRDIGDRECGIPEQILAYILRVDPAAAKPRIEKQIATRRKKGSHCSRSTFTDIAAIQYNPVLEEIAIRALEDQDAATAADAARVLGKFGSPAAEEPLWRRYEKWSSRWAGHEAELNFSEAEYDIDDYRVAQMSLGSSLFNALATGQGWLTDQAKLRRLIAMNKIPPIVNQAQRYLEQWNRQPLTLGISCSPPPPFNGHLAQYNFQSNRCTEAETYSVPCRHEISSLVAVDRRAKPVMHC